MSGESSCACGHPDSDHYPIPGACMHLCDCAWPDPTAPDDHEAMRETKADFLLDGSPEAVALVRAARTASDDREAECTCAMTEGSQRRCAVHGEDAPDDHEAMRERLAAELREALGAGTAAGLLVTQEVAHIADALLAAGWRDDGDEPVQRARLQAHIDHGNDLRAALDGGPR